MCWAQWENLQEDFVNLLVLWLSSSSQTVVIEQRGLSFYVWCVRPGPVWVVSSASLWLPWCCLHVLFLIFLTLQITVRASVSPKFWPRCVRCRPVTGTWWPSRSAAVMEDEAGAPTVNFALYQGPPSTRKCVPWDLDTPQMAEVLTELKEIMSMKNWEEISNQKETTLTKSFIFYTTTFSHDVLIKSKMLKVLNF